MRKPLTMLCGAAAATVACGLFAAPANAVQSTSPDAQTGRGTAVVAAAQPAADAAPFVEERDSDDGVKGKIKNYAGYPVKLTFNQNYERVLQPGDEVTYYSGRYERVDVMMSRLDGTRQANLIISDRTWKPETTFWPNWKDRPRSDRSHWSEEDSHHEIWGDTTLWLKREKDGWNGGYETWHNRDWAVFTVHIDSLQK